MSLLRLLLLRPSSPSLLLLLLLVLLLLVSPAVHGVHIFTVRRGGDGGGGNGVRSVNSDMITNFQNAGARMWDNDKAFDQAGDQQYQGNQLQSRSNGLLRHRAMIPRQINPYNKGPYSRPHEPACTMRNYCKPVRFMRLPEDPIAKRVGRGVLLGIQRSNGYPPDPINSPVNVLLTDIPENPWMEPPPEAMGE